MRLIDANVVVKGLVEVRDGLKEGFPKRFQQETIRKALRVVEESPTIEVGPVRWIPVTERLPEKEGWYHVAILDIKKGKYAVEQDLYAIKLAKRNGHKPGFCKARRWEEREKLTHWMPFPEPPKMDLKDRTLNE